MRFLFSTGSLWTYGIDRCFDFAARAGFDGIELMVDQRHDTRQAGHLRSLTERTGQPVVAVHSPFSPATPGWPSFEDEPGRILATLRLGEELGASVLVHHLPEKTEYLPVALGGRRLRVPRPGAGCNARYREWLGREYPHVQANTDMLLCIENMPARRVFGRKVNAQAWNTPEQIADFPHVTLDTTHLGTWGMEPADVYDRFGGKIRHVHLSNYDGREHRRPEAGRLHLDRLLARLGADGFPGTVSLELHPDTLDAGGDDDRVVGLLTESLRRCREWSATGVAAPSR